MTTLQHKIDFAALVTVEHANPNGDPLAGNRPREDYNGFGEISDVCIKRKIRNRLMDLGESVFVQADDRALDEFRSLRERANACETVAKAMKEKDRAAIAEAACNEWIDVRGFGQLFAFQGETKNDGKGVSVGIRGPVSIHPAFSIDPVMIEEVQITKSTNADSAQNAKGEITDKKSSDTMGTKSRVSFGLYLIKGSINCQLAEKTGFSEEDSEKIKRALATLFENDASSSRPEGSIEVRRLYWWKHDCKMGQYSSAVVHRSLHIEHAPDVEEPRCFEDYIVTLDPLEKLEPEVVVRA